MSRFQKAQDILLGFGVTGVGAMSTSLDDWNAYRRAGEAGQLKVRLMAYALNGPLPEVPHPTPWLYGDRLRMVGAKFFADGALGSRGAWLKQPYADKPDTRGLPVPFGRRAPRDGGPRGRRRLPDRDPRDRRCGQCADDLRL